MSEKGNVVVASPSSTPDSGNLEKAASSKQELTVAKPPESESVSGSVSASASPQKASPPKKPTQTPQPRHYSENYSPRKTSQQAQPTQQQPTSPPRRKFSQRQYYSQANPQCPPFHHQQFPPTYQFQPTYRKLTNQRQQSLPTFRNFHVLPDQNFVVPSYGQPPRPPMMGPPRRGSSASATFQPRHDQQQQDRDRAFRKASYQQGGRYDSSAGNQLQKQQQQAGAGVGEVGSDGRRRSAEGKNRKKSAEAPAAAAATGNTRSAKMSIPAPRWSSFSENMENGSGEYDYYSDDFEMEEPFSDSDDDETPEEREARRKRQAKPLLLLPMPRRRIRTLSGMIPAVGHAPVWGGPTMCLNCLEFFDLPKQTAEYVQHLLDKHRIVVTDIELIVDLKRYIEHWRHRFGQQPIEKTFPMVTPKETDPLFGKVDNYYLMSEKVPEDRQIRERLALRRLEEVLSCQQREREDRTFNRQCLFCRYRTKGNRAKLVHHLYTIHHLNLGSPDNLVFVSEYLDVLEGKLKRNECIYCEKTFPDHQTLSEHMRKKQHREVNPKNNYYDRFYVINYLELGKKWLEVLAEDFEDNTPTFIDSDEEEEEESWNEWQEDAEDENDTTAVCLLCDEAYEQAEELLGHMKKTHQYDLKKIFEDGHFGFYDRVKFINYIRKLSHECICFVCGTEDLRSWPALRKHLANVEHLKVSIDRSKWDKDEFLIPTYDNDNLLCLLEDILPLGEEDFVTYVRNDKPEPMADIKTSSHDHDTIPEDAEDEKDEEEPVKNQNGEKKSAEDADGATVGEPMLVVIPEDLPQLDDDSALKDPELVEQLK